MGTKIMVSTNTGIACGTSPTAKTILSYTAPSGVAARVLRYGISLDGTSSTDARAVIDFLKKPATAGTPGSDISSEIAVISGKGTSLGAAGQNFSAEPTTNGSSRILRPHQMAPTGPFQTLLGIDLDPSEQICMRVISTGRAARAWMEIELG